MPESTTKTVDELARLKERARILAQDKSYLQLIINLMNKVSAAQGLDNMIEALLNNILDVIGGTNIILYYRIDEDLYRADLFTKQLKLDRIDDDLVRKSFDSGEPQEVEHDFSDTQMLTPEFTMAYTWVFPLLAGGEMVGVIKLENLHIAMRKLYSELPTFFAYVASALKNEIVGLTRLEIAYDRVSEMNEELKLKIEERTEIEGKLLLASDELEERVAKRTEELRNANEQIRHELEERTSAEEALRKSAEEILDLYNHAPCGYHSLDKDGLFIRVNDTELQWLGYTREEIVDVKKFADLLTESSLRLFQDHFPLFKAQGCARDLEFEMVRKDGTILPVLLGATAITDNDGNFIMSRSTIYDISERKIVAETEHLLSAIVQSSNDAIIGKDPNEVILSWNKGAERIYGYSAEEAVGQRIPMLVPPEQEGELKEIMAALRRGEMIEHYKTERLRKDGRRISVSLTISPLKDAAGCIVGASAIARDITEQVRAEEDAVKLNADLEQRVADRTSDLVAKGRELLTSQQALMNIVEDLNAQATELEKANARLQELERLKSMFIASMSHELRTPLNSIIGFASILLNEWLGPVNVEQKENLATILRSGKHLLTLINDVIDVSKIEAGKIEVRPEEFDLYDLLTEAIQYVVKDIQEKGLALHLGIEHRRIFTDKQRLLQCVINLLSNAVKFTKAGSITLVSSGSNGPPDGEAEDLTRQETSFVIITVQDTGIGIAEEDISRLFQPFVRLVSPLWATIPGTGLGLYLTRKLTVEVLRGEIHCQSTLGEGSTFTLSIPERLNEKGTGN